jgi:hypothetical protein
LNAFEFENDEHSKENLPIQTTCGNKWSPVINGVRRLKIFAHASKPANPPFDPAITREVKLFCKPRSTLSLQAITGEVFALLSRVVFVKTFLMEHAPGQPIQTIFDSNPL